jgi:hypothetical protein
MHIDVQPENRTGNSPDGSQSWEFHSIGQSGHWPNESLPDRQKRLYESQPASKMVSIPFVFCFTKSFGSDGVSIASQFARTLFCGSRSFDEWILKLGFREVQHFIDFVLGDSAKRLCCGLLGDLQISLLRRSYCNIMVNKGLRNASKTADFFLVGVFRPCWRKIF